MAVGTLDNPTIDPPPPHQEALGGSYVGEAAFVAGQSRTAGASPAAGKVPRRIPSNFSSLPASAKGATSAPRAYMVRALPWAVSLAIHLGLAAAATLVALVVVERGRDLIIPGAVLSAEPLAVAAACNRWAASTARRLRRGPCPLPLKAEVARPDAAISASPEVQRSAALVTASPAALSPSRPMGLAAEAVSRAPASSFMGAGGYAHHVVYVVDCSGSMVSNFDDSRKAVLLSISKLQESQDFHVILFTNGKAIEMSPGRLMQAVTSNKMQVADFLADVRVQNGQRPDSRPFVARSTCWTRPATPRAS